MPLKDPEARKAFQKAYYDRRKKQILEQQREYRELNAEKIYKRNKKYVEKNREKHRAWTLKANRKWRANHTKEFSQYVLEWKRKHPEIWKANTAVHRALKKGTLVRPDHCTFCGRPGKPQAHHADYSKPLEVIWLCSPCHKEADKKRALLEAQN